MFINKSSAVYCNFSDACRLQNMTQYLNGFFSSEITCIPAILKSCVGDYFDNALCNASTWAVVGWSLLHWIFYNLLYNIFRKLKYKEYICERLTKNLWYWGYYGTSLIYCGTTLAHSDMELFNFKRMTVPTDKAVPVQVVVGYTLINTFYIHSALWENSNLSECVIYLLLATVCSISYILRVPEICFTLTALIALSKFLIENTRLVYIFFGHGGYIKRFAVWISFMVAFAFFIAIHIIVVPLTFIVPLGLKVLSDYPNLLLIILCSTLLLWLMVELYNSILFQFFDHWFYHNNKELSYQCEGNTLECSLFPPRIDEAYNLQIIRREIKKKEQEMMSRRRPKNKNVWLQTLKCMVAIKKKISSRKLQDSPTTQIQMISRQKTNPEIDDSDEEFEEEMNILERKQKTRNEEKQDSADSDDEATDSEEIFIDTDKSLKIEDVSDDNSKTALTESNSCIINDHVKLDGTGIILANTNSLKAKTDICEVNKAVGEEDIYQENESESVTNTNQAPSLEEQPETDNDQSVVTVASPITTRSVELDEMNEVDTEEKADVLTSSEDILSPLEEHEMDKVSDSENANVPTTRKKKSVKFSDDQGTKDPENEDE